MLTIINQGAVMVVTAVSIGVSLVSSFIHRRNPARKKMDGIRGDMERLQKDYVQAQKDGNTERVKKLEQDQMELLNDMKKNMMATMRPTMYTLPVILVIFWLLGSMYGSAGTIIDMPIGIPFLTHNVTANVTINGATTLVTAANGMDWFGLYILLAITASLLAELVLGKLMKG